MEGRWAKYAKYAPLILVAVAILFDAARLTPELRPVPSFNDGRWHYLLVQRASAALSNGDNPVDFWVPNFGLGFPQFLYYQHLPHLAIVLLNRLLLKRVDLLTLFNLVRYLLMVLFPLTVYLSARLMDMSIGGAAAAGAFASLLSGYSQLEGFNYQSYIFNGLGLYTELWAMHLFVLSIATVYRVMEKGSGYLSAIIFSSMLVMSHLLYAYMAAISVFAIFIAGMIREPRRA